MEEDTLDTGALLVPRLGILYRGLAPASYSFMRFATGAVLFPHGVQKALYGSIARYAATITQHDLPFPTVLAYCTVFAELVGAACLALGLLTRVMAAIIWLEMTVIITVFQWHFGYFWTNRGYEYALLWWLLCLGIMFRGGGRYSLDRLIGREL